MKEAQGMVVSAKMNKTVVVRLEKLVQHPILKKYVVQRTRIKARDEKGCHEGDIVRIASTRPLSKQVSWRVIEVVGRRTLADAPVEAGS